VNVTQHNHIEPKEKSGANGFALAKGDLSILKEVHEYRFLRREHLSLLTGRDPKRLHRRLLKLVQYGYLLAIRLPQQKHIYSIGRAGFRANPPERTKMRASIKWMKVAAGLCLRISGFALVSVDGRNRD
jgi:hypothetical protein